MKESEFLGKPFDCRKMEKAGFEADNIFDFGPDPVYRLLVERKPDGIIEDNESDYISYWLLVYTEADRIAGLSRLKEESLFSEDGQPVKRFPAHMEKKAEKALRSIMMCESLAVPVEVEYTGDFFMAAAKAAAAARSGRRLLFRSGPFVFASCTNGGLRDAWALEPLKKRALCLVAENGCWRSDAAWDTGSITFFWDGTYGVGGIGDENGKCLMTLDVTFTFNGKARCVGGGKRFIDRFMDLEREVHKEFGPKRRKKK